MNYPSCENGGAGHATLLTTTDKDEVLADEAEDALEWCIALAQEIVDAELALRNGSNTPYHLEATRQWVWDRFRNLEAGLMSNGVKRPV